MPDPTSHALLMLGRALRLRCPNCGKGKPFVSWFRMRSQCEVCGLAFERGEEGYQVGSYMFNIVAAELVFAAVFLAIVVATWPSPPWTLLPVWRHRADGGCRRSCSSRSPRRCSWRST